MNCEELKTEYLELQDKTRMQSQHIEMLEQMRSEQQKRILSLSEALLDIQNKCFDLRTKMIALDVHCKLTEVAEDKYQKRINDMGDVATSSQPTSVTIGADGKYE